MRSTIDRPSPRPRTELAVSSQALELLEDQRVLAIAGCRGRCRRPARRARSPRRRTPSSTLPRGGVLDGIGDQVLQHAAQQAPVGAHPRPASARCAARSPFSRASGSNSTSQPLEHLVRAETSVISGSSRPASRREISISAPRISSTASSEASMLRASVRLLAAERALDQARRIEPRRIERLQQVVAGRRQEARLVEVGLVGLALGDRQRLVDLESARPCARARGAPASRWRAPAPRRPSTRSVMSE